MPHLLTGQTISELNTCIDLIKKHNIPPPFIYRSRLETTTVAMPMRKKNQHFEEIENVSSGLDKRLHPWCPWKSQTDKWIKNGFLSNLSLPRGSKNHEMLRQNVALNGSQDYKHIIKHEKKKNKVSTPRPSYMTKKKPVSPQENVLRLPAWWWTQSTTNSNWKWVST